MCPAACALCLLWHKVHAQARPFCPILSFLSPCPGAAAQTTNCNSWPNVGPGRMMD